MLRSVDGGTVGQTSDLPAEFYASQVDALYSDTKSFVIGSAGACTAILAVGCRTGSVFIFAVAMTLAVLAAVRLGSMRFYAHHYAGRAALAVLQRAEYRYHVGAAAHIGIIGLFCLVTFLVTASPVDRMLALATVLAYMAGIPGRNFANASGVDAQILCGGIPLLFAMAVAGSAFWTISLVVLAPFFFALRGLSSRLRGIFVQATVKAHDFSLLANRFDTALNNMSHGLAMFGRDGRVAVTNERLLELMLFDPLREYSGQKVETVFANVGTLARGEDDPLGKVQARIAEPTADALEIEMSNGTSLEFTFQSMQTGGAVVLVQEITERKRAEARINQLALYDELTGLANRAHFRTQMQATLARCAAGDRHALLFIDLDQFKQVNDTLGHSRGDLLIQEVAARLRAHLGADSMIARFGGDEFVVLRRLDQGPVDPDTVAGGLIDRISKPYRIDGHDIVIGASIGIAVCPDHDTEPDQILKKADLALYRAKADGRGSCRLFEPRMDIQARARSELEFDLRQALKNDEFEVFFQPIFNLKLRRFALCEALLRWRHPKRGMVPPMEFIPVAEEMGLIVDIGNLVLKRACLECAKWPSNVAVAVNISPLQFRRGDIVTSVTTALREAGLPAHRLELELTESVLLQDVAFTSVTMNLLHIQQVRISLDDFGTGYSSLSYLNKLPLNKVKIDRSFLTGLGTNAKTTLMLRGLTRLTAELGLSVVIEGVETDEQLRLITEATDVEEIQGYLFSRPLPAVEVISLLHAEAANAPPKVEKIRLAN